MENSLLTRITYNFINIIHVIPSLNYRLFLCDFVYPRFEYTSFIQPSSSPKIRTHPLVFSFIQAIRYMVVDDDSSQLLVNRQNVKVQIAQ